MSERDQILVDELLALVDEVDEADHIEEDDPGASTGLDRENREVLGLLPYSLAPVQPRSELKDRLMAAVSDVSVSPEHEIEPVRPAEVRAAEPVDQLITFPEPRVAASSRSWVPSALAAALVACLLGLAFLAGRLQEQARLIESMNAVQAESAVRDSRLEVMARDLDRTRDRLTMVTTIARQAYPLRTVTQTGSRRAANGIVYVCGNHQRWYLSLQGLDSPPPGEQYNLWFMTAEGSVNAGVLEVGADASVDLEAPSMPLGTEGFAVSLERKGEHQEPEGIMILLGENSVSL